MSKAVHSPLGQWRGRTGGQVYRVNHGQQIVSAYQPKVANPRTNNQQKQRAKFNLMTKLNSITPSILLTPYSPTAGVARPMFSKSLMKYIEVQELELVGGSVEYRAAIAAADIHFGEGNTLFPEGIAFGTDIIVSSTPNGVSVQVLESAFVTDVIGVRVIDVCRTVGEGGQYIDVRYHDFMDPDGEIIEFDGEGMQHRVYFQFIIRHGSTSSLRTGNLTDEEDTAGGDISSSSIQLFNSNAIVGSSMYYQSYWIPESV